MSLIFLFSQRKELQDDLTVNEEPPDDILSGRQHFQQNKCSERICALGAYCHNGRTYGLTDKVIWRDPKSLGKLKLKKVVSIWTHSVRWSRNGGFFESFSRKFENTRQRVQAPFVFFETVHEWGGNELEIHSVLSINEKCKKCLNNKIEIHFRRWYRRAREENWRRKGQN